jgi:2-succinyl-5-enolpyruvyl-6-hydroxy-3-cyclohexene-1-carboxylate synthase
MDKKTKTKDEAGQIAAELIESVNEMRRVLPISDAMAYWCNNYVELFKRGSKVTGGTKAVEAIYENCWTKAKTANDGPVAIVCPVFKAYYGIRNETGERKEFLRKLKQIDEKYEARSEVDRLEQAKKALNQAIKKFEAKKQKNAQKTKKQSVT